MQPGVAGVVGEELNPGVVVDGPLVSDYPQKE